MKDDFAEAAEGPQEERPDTREAPDVQEKNETRGEAAAAPKKTLPNPLPMLTGRLKRLPFLGGRGRALSAPPGKPLGEKLRPAIQAILKAARALRRFFKKDSIPNLVLVMTLLTTVTAAGLGVAHTVAQPRIETAKAGLAEAAMAKVFSGQELNFTRSSLGKNIYEGRGEDGELIGFAILVSPKGYTGPVDMVVGVGIRRELIGVEVIAHREFRDHTAAIEQGVREALASFDRGVQP